MSINWGDPALIAFRVIPHQFMAQVGSPPKLVTIDPLSGCGIPQLPPGLAAIATLINSGHAFTIGSVMTAALDALAPVLGPLQGFINAATDGLLSNLMNLWNAIQVGDFATIGGMIAQFTSNIGNSSGVIASMSAMATSMGLPALPALTTIFSGVLGGQIDAALGPVKAAVDVIVSELNVAIASGIGAIAGVIPTITAALTSAAATALAAISPIIDQVNAAIAAAVGSFGSSLASASGIFGGMACAELGAFASFIRSIATTALQNVLPH